jgi:hypothetical protein
MESDGESLSNEGNPKTQGKSMGDLLQSTASRKDDDEPEGKFSVASVTASRMGSSNATMALDLSSFPFKNVASKDTLMTPSVAFPSIFHTHPSSNSCSPSGVTKMSDKTPTDVVSPPSK